MIRVTLALIAVTAATVATPRVQAGTTAVPADKLATCVFSSAYGGDALELNPVLIRSRDPHAGAGFCRARVRCETSRGRPASFEAYCRAQAGQSCPDASSCVWEAASIREIPAQAKPVLASNDFVVSGTVEGFDERSVTISLRSKRSLRLPRSAFQPSRNLEDGQLVHGHLTEKQMLDYGLFEPVPQSSLRSRAARNQDTQIPLVE